MFLTKRRRQISKMHIFPYSFVREDHLSTLVWTKYHADMPEVSPEFFSGQTDAGQFFSIFFTQKIYAKILSLRELDRTKFCQRMPLFTIFQEHSSAAPRRPAADSTFATQ